MELSRKVRRDVRWKNNLKTESSQETVVNAQPPIPPFDESWEEVFNEKVGRTMFRKELFRDSETGMMVRLVRYPAGFVTPNHTHPCGHGMYVLEGTLITHKGAFGPGSFVWFPEGEIMEHGASADGNVTAIFITNKPFRIDYV